MKPYPRYKPTGLAWLPSVPEHWETKRLKNLFEERKEVNRDGENTCVLSLLKDVGVIPYEEKGNIGNKSKEDITQYKIARKGDLVLNSMNVIIGSVGVSEYDGCVSPVYYALRPRKGTNAKYYEHVMRLPNVQKVIRGRANGILEIRLRISAGALLDLSFPLPPPSEQDRIVRYLDEKTAAIDELVRAKEREIDLLRERKQALVSAAVTGGAGNLNTEAQRHRDTESNLAGLPEFRDSGIPWIGKIPKGWVVVKLSRRYSVQLGKMLDAKKIKGQSLMPYLRNQDVQWEGVNSENLPKMDFSAEEQVRFGVRKGDLLVCEGGEIGRCAIWDSDKPCCFQKAIIRLRPRKPAEDFVRFMWYLMFAATANHAFDFATGKATIAHLPAEKLSVAQFAFPPLPEQRRIVAHLDSVCSELDAAEATIHKQIALLQELRTRLVSDAVTGAVEV